MSSRLKKALLLTLAAASLAAVFFLQGSLNHDRDQLGLTRMQPLESAPPVLAFTTVALGGFRGLISNMLWIRAQQLQDEDKFFEMAQLADWITKLEPNYVQVWLVQAWNMAYNISVKFTDFADRWRWVERGIELLRDQGLPANQNAVLMYRELAWFFQHKMGANLDDAHMYYKQQWAREMGQVFGKFRKPDLDELIDPQTDDQKARARLLREKYKMDPSYMKEVDQRYGPLEWRLPEAHAIYWAALGLKIAANNPSKVKDQDLITLRRVIYQSMQTSFQRGRLVTNPFAKAFEFGPNLDIIPKVSAAYEQAAEEDAPNHDHILNAYKNFLKDAIYFLYEYNHMSDAAFWYKYLAAKYPNDSVLDGRPNSRARDLSLDQYCLSRIQEDANGTPRDRIEAAIEGQIMNSYRSLSIDEDDHAAGYRALALKLWDNYMRRIPAERRDPVGLRPFKDIDREILNRVLDPEHGATPEVRAVLRTKLRLPAETPPTPAPATNAPPEKPQE
ncbi:MAG: hypothetical protein ABSH34_16415 [Verrucomicrobiota bacterium]|jgi:hypothetical protein